MSDAGSVHPYDVHVGSDGVRHPVPLPWDEYIGRALARAEPGESVNVMLDGPGWRDVSDYVLDAEVTVGREPARRVTVRVIGPELTDEQRQLLDDWNERMQAAVAARVQEAAAAQEAELERRITEGLGITGGVGIAANRVRWWDDRPADVLGDLIAARDLIERAGPAYSPDQLRWLSRYRPLSPSPFTTFGDSILEGNRAYSPDEMRWDPSEADDEIEAWFAMTGEAPPWSET